MLELPKNFESYDEKRRNAFLALYEEKKKGKKVVGTFCSYTPTELIHAAGAIPVGLCGNSEQGILEAETRLPKSLCPLIKSSYEELGLPYLRVDTDFSQSDRGQIETRLGAFIEMMA